MNSDTPAGRLTHPGSSAAELAALGDVDRLLLARWLSESQLRKYPSRGRLRRRTLGLASMTLATVILVPWVAYLAATLPDRIQAHDWDVAWVGFDSALIAAIVFTVWLRRGRRPPAVFFLLLAPAHHDWDVAWVGFDSALIAAIVFTVWLGWRRRQLAVFFLLVTGTILICDAWFDVTLSWGPTQPLPRIIPAVFVGVPAAVFMFATCVGAIQILISQVRHERGDLPPGPSMWRQPFLITFDPPDDNDRSE